MKIALFTTFATLGMLLLLVTINDQATQLSERYELQSANSSQNKTENGYRWQAATFRGLKIGQATIDEVLSILGKPKWIGPEADQDQSKPNPTLYYSFEGGGNSRVKWLC